MAKTTVSIITPTYNSELYISDTYKSLIAQTYTDWEWLVTDDCSVDATVRIISEISRSDKRVRMFRNKNNEGAAMARNKSSRNATGEFIAFLDADDQWVESKLERQLLFMGREIDFSFTGYEIVNENGMSLGQFVDINHEGAFSYEDMLRKKATLGCSTVMLRKCAFNDIVMPNIRTGQDYALWLKLLKTGKKAILLREPLTKYRIVPHSISRNKLKKALRQWEIYTQIEKLGTIKKIECFILYVYRALFRM